MLELISEDPFTKDLNLPDLEEVFLAFGSVDLEDEVSRNNAIVFLKTKTFWDLVNIEYRIKDLKSELVELIEEIDGLKGFGPRFQTTTKLTVKTKLFYITWDTLIETCLELINISLDLGLRKKHINFSSIMENNHVEKSPIPGIVEQNKKRLKIVQYNKLRNAIVHEGILNDKEIASISKKFKDLYNRKYGIMSRVEMSEADFDKEHSDLFAELNEISRCKAHDFANQLRRTIEFYNQLAGVLKEHVLNRIVSGSIKEMADLTSRST